MSDPALTIPGLYWQIHRLAQTPLDHAGRPAFIGVVPDAGDGEPVLVEGWARYRDRFGGVDATSPAAARSFHLAVRGFFANGGARCRIVPVEGALTASTLAAALARLEDEEDTSLVVAPGVVDPALQAAIVTHCETLGDRFAVLDLPEPDALNAAAAADAAIAHAEWLWRAADGRHAALYGPWLKVVAFDGTAFVPPSGHVAGVYARVDARSGPAPRAGQRGRRRHRRPALRLRRAHHRPPPPAARARRDRPPRGAVGQCHPGAARPWHAGVGRAHALR
ncbi:MAG: phage tail sheath subtilisin-like domain-containing protein [Myxococcales bacterium]|nr:phage tail sheath subtilisin-like domain-containing protein [Myxococcales bacterium]